MFGAFALCALLTALTDDPAVPSPQETSELSKVVSSWTELGEWAVERKLGDEARLAALEARRALGAPALRGTAAAGAKDEVPARVARLEESSAACPNDPAATDRRSWDERLARTRKNSAKRFEELFLAGEKELRPPARERFDGYLLLALRTEPSKDRWGRVVAVAERRSQQNRAPEAARIADGALAIDAPGKAAQRLLSVIQGAALSSTILRTATKHPLRYYFRLPAKFKRAPGKRWPVLICVDGAGSNFEGMANGYVGARGDLPCIIVSPCTFSNTNQIVGNDDQLKKYRLFYPEDVIHVADRERLDWDEAGVVQVIEDLVAQFDAEPHVYVTGFSGGGNVCYMLLFKHPARVMAAAPACANFGRPDYSESLAGKSGPEDLRFAVHILTGEKDPHREWTFGKVGNPGIEQQTDWAMEVVRALGYPSVRRTMLSGVDHSSCTSQVLDFFRPYMLGKKKRGDPPDG